MNNVTLIDKGGGIAECRICGLNFLPDLKEEREQHEHKHRIIVCGGMPFQLREFLKGFGWAIAENGDGFEELKGKWSPEIGKRAVVFSWWSRALACGIPENDFERFMAAHFAYVDASVAGDELRIDQAAAAIKPWAKYGG